MTFVSKTFTHEDHIRGHIIKKPHAFHSFIGTPPTPQDVLLLALLAWTEGGKAAVNKASLGAGNEDV